MAANAEATVTLSLIDRVTGPIKRIGARLGALSKRIGFDRVSAAVGNLGGRIKGLGEGLASTSARLASFLGLLGVGGAGAITAAYGLAKSAADVGAEVFDMAGKLGLAAETLQEYRFAAKMSGVEVATFDKGVEKLGINAVQAAKGNKELAKAFKSLGVRVKDSKGNMRGIEDILDDTMSRLASIEDPLKRNALAFKLFGKSGVDLTKMMADGASGIRELREEARRTGNVFSKEATEAADELGDNVDALKERMEGLKNFVGAQLIPVFNEAVKGITAWYDANAALVRSTITEWVQKLGGFIRDLLDPTSQVRVKFDEFTAAISAAYSWIKPFVDFIGGPFVAAMALIGLWALAPAITAIVLLGDAFRKLGLSIGGVAVSTVSALSGAIADMAGAGLAKSLEAAGATSGALWGKAFALAARLAIIAGIAAITMEVLEKYDPKGNLGGLTKPVDDWLRSKLGLPTKDTGITPGEIWDGLFGSSDKPADKTSSAAPAPREQLTPVARDLGFDRSPIFADITGRDAGSAASRRYGAPVSTDTAPGKAMDDVVIPDSVIVHEPKQTTVNVTAPVSLTINAPPGLDAAGVAALARREIEAAGQRNAAAMKSSLSDD